MLEGSSNISLRKSSMTERLAFLLEIRFISPFNHPGGTHKDGAERSGVREAPFYRWAQHGVPNEG